MRSEIIESIDQITPNAWNRLNDGDNPFIQHAFLSALERHDCVGERYGWLPQHVAVYEGDALVGAMPMYIKDNSYGEFVFDWGWADAYHRSGLPYYPKLVTSVPYTPATGPRLLTDPQHARQPIAQMLIDAALEHAQRLGVSSMHWLFTEAADNEQLEAQQLPFRLGCQFHWTNRAYRDFKDYLEAFTASKRKKIKRERRRVREQGIELEIRHGDEMDERLWRIYHDFYCDTFERKSGIPTLSFDFFCDLGERMPRNVVLVFAKHQGRYVASAFNLRGRTTLYGRHWGCLADFHSLHFEACYYQGLDYSIEHGLARFEPGAQGEHKISRGFLPTPTWSAHWIAHPQMRAAIADFCAREQRAMNEYIDTLSEHSPFKATVDGTLE